MPNPFTGKIVCPHCGGDLLDHIKTLWGRWRSLHNQKRSGFANVEEHEHKVLSQIGGRKAWDISAEERAERIKKMTEARWGKK